MPRSTRRIIRSSSSGVGRRSTLPITVERIVPCGIRWITFGPHRGHRRPPGIWRRRQPETAVAGDDGRHALRQVILVQSRGRLGDSVVRMGVQVDKPRSHHERRHVDNSCSGINRECRRRRRSCRQSRRRPHAVPAAGAVDQRATPQNEVGPERTVQFGSRGGCPRSGLCLTNR